MLRQNVLTLLFCILASWSPSSGLAASSSDGRVATQVVRAGETLLLTPPVENLQTLAALGGGILQPLDGSLNAPADGGEHWLAMASRDRLGHLSPIRWVRLLVDDQRPVVLLQTDPEAVDADGKAWVPGGTRVTAQASDDLAGIETLRLEFGDLSEDGAGDQLSLQLPNQGHGTVLGSSTDRVGWRSEDAKLALWIDSEPPEGRLYFDGPQVPGTGGGRIVIAPGTRLVAEIADAKSGLDAWTPETDGLEVAPEAWNGPWTAGEHRASARAVDRVGNEAVIGPVDLVVDDQAPRVTWSIESEGYAGEDGQTWYVGPVVIAASAVDVPAGVERFESSLDGQEFVPFSREQTVDGDRLILRASDRLGQVATEEVRILIDRQPPVIVLRDPDGDVVPPDSHIELIRDQALRVSVKDGQSGLSETRHRLNKYPETVLPEILRFRDRGEFRLEIRAVDRAGLETVAVWTIRVRQAPKKERS